MLSSCVDGNTVSDTGCHCAAGQAGAFCCTVEVDNLKIPDLVLLIIV